MSIMNGGKEMKAEYYDRFVNRHPGIKIRYHKFHDTATGARKYLSWLYLLWLNFCYHVLRIRTLGITEEMAVYEEKKIPEEKSETELLRQDGISVESFVERLSTYEVISFDIFDTLIFRPFSEPTDLFFFLGEKLGRMDFKNLRRQMEETARQVCYKKNGHYEVTLWEIWEELEWQTGWPAVQGLQEEIELEKQFCYANPFMLKVYAELKKRGKRMIAVSDMYLPKKVLEEILQKNGFIGFEKLFISCEYKKSKSKGDLYDLVRSEFPENAVHVGDNEYSDVTMAEKHGFSAFYYPNGNERGRKYRAYDMSAIIGGAYRGIVNHHLYCRTNVYSMEYEYGFIYGGLFVTGYCAFIHEYCKVNNIDKVLFFSRDGDILKQAYELLFPGERTEYVYWSRRAATKLMAREDRYDFFRRFLYHKVNQKLSLKQIFHSMELDAFLDELPEAMTPQDELTEKNVKKVQAYLVSRWEQVLAAYEGEHRAARAYYAEILNDCRKAVAVDIGWAGSGAVALNHLVQKIWKLSCDIVGIIAGTNTIHNAEPDAAETFLQTGKLVAYLYSQGHNRDLLKKHDPNRNYNVYWELLLSSPTPQFIGFSESKEKGWKLRFGENETNREGICEIQAGILTFVKEYKDHFGHIPYMYKISGRDAYAPMLLACSNGEKYLKEIAKRFAPEIHVG